MRIRSDSFEPRRPIPSEFALGTPDGFGGNRNPHLVWDEVPDGARAFALLCIDPDAPTVGEMVNKDGVQIPAEQTRTEFHHWVMADIPADLREITAGSCSDGPTKGGKRNPPGPAGARQGLNDYTSFFAGDDAMGGEYFGYDGPYPPSNDLRTHRYFFRLFALDVERLELPEKFTAGDVLAAMHDHVLAEAAVYGTYSLNPDAQG
ncbi:YbhB/YbcL family Raf kinase inhibitor-like protein [Luteimonas suaedae]|uniref:YbhB/YbcL family Raf kinase inhibitor-like protein n=1 Tax=Luteimonas suaedae TaxID=2605430 RepID=UPI0011EEBEE0|nr:YbhB/YbcL family Raf kinase inhibitor-like protein [Luteimonas suaedae]